MSEVEKAASLPLPVTDEFEESEDEEATFGEEALELVDERRCGTLNEH